MLGDPFSTPITKLSPALTTCGGTEQPVPVAGGMCSGASQPGHNVLVQDAPRTIVALKTAQVVCDLRKHYASFSTVGHRFIFLAEDELHEQIFTLEDGIALEFAAEVPIVALHR